MATAVKQQTSLKISDLFQVFVRERELLKNVSPNTLIWHQQSYRAFQPFIGTLDIDDDLRGAVKAGIGNLAGHLKASSVNGYVRSMNAFFNWLHAEGYVKDRLKFGRLKEPESLPPVLPDPDIDVLLRYKPTHGQETTAHVIALCILDIGARINELRNLKRDQIDFDTCVLLIDKGKGRKQRQLPFSPILRSHLMKYIRHHTLTQPQYKTSPYVFVTKTGTLYSYRNLMRALHTFAEKAGYPGAKVSPVAAFNGYRISPWWWWPCSSTTYPWAFKYSDNDEVRASCHGRLGGCPSGTFAAGAQGKETLGRRVTPALFGQHLTHQHLNPDSVHPHVFQRPGPVFVPLSQLQIAGSQSRHSRVQTHQKRVFGTKWWTNL